MWNNNVRQAHDRETFVDGARVINGVGNREIDFVEIIFQDFVEDATARICRQKNFA
jgi:hypothetical protein